jgi:hypothetical protein
MRLLIFAILLAGYATAAADNYIDDSTASCYPYWQTGDSRTYELRSGTIRMQADSSDTSSTSYKATISVADSTADGYIMKWDNHDLPDFGGGRKNLLDNFIMQIKSIPTFYSVGEYGSLIGMKNIEEYKVKIDSAISRLGSEAELSESAQNNLRNMFLDDDFITRTVLNEINLYHSPYSGIYSIAKDSLVYPVSANNGDTIWTRVYFKINEINHAEDFYDMTVRVDYDPETVNRSIRPYIAENVKRMSPETDSVDKMIDEALAQSRMYDIQNYHISLSTGWIRSLYSQRIVEVNYLAKYKNIEFLKMITE